MAFAPGLKKHILDFNDEHQTADVSHVSMKNVP